MKDLSAPDITSAQPSQYRVEFTQAQQIKRIEVRALIDVGHRDGIAHGPIDIYFSSGNTPHTVYLQASLSDVMNAVMRNNGRTGPVARDDVKIAFMTADGQVQSETSVAEYKAWSPFLGYNHKA